MAYFQVNKNPRLTFPTLTGYIVTFNSQYAGLPLKSHKIALTATQSGSGTPSPDNVRPISGFTEANIKHCGKNLLENVMQSGTQSGVTFTVNADGTISTSGKASAAFARAIYSKWPIEFLKGQNAYISGAAEGSQVSGNWRIMLYYHDKNGSDVGQQTVIADGALLDIPQTAVDASVTIDISKNATTNGLVFAPQIELGTSASAYEKYNGTTYPISWQTEAGTVYGGTLTINEDGSVDLVSEWRKEIYTSSLSPIASGQSSGLTWCTLEKVLSDSQKAYAETPTAGDGNGILNVGAWQRGSAGAKPRAFVTTSLKSLQVVLVSDTYDLRTAQGRTDYYANTLNGTNPEVCYRLTTPVTYHLDSIEQISTLAGENNIWADVNGEITLTYLAQAE